MLFLLTDNLLFSKFFSLVPTYFAFFLKANDPQWQHSVTPSFFDIYFKKSSRTK
ncbi:hypothetical protein P3TCK_06022 [Photobacterium profundum 3TCK]|uniref:Uncharacterized protein n=1 Tax=Photobacterium profundum 3TCK TaxID=314280 RepID=Q1Z737_9GAMM|nr:hypothetical protein P3TCK_06022 [Photobacterium profundum 3TCK]